jgi:hypothetical protein
MLHTVELSGTPQESWTLTMEDNVLIADKRDSLF